MKAVSFSVLLWAVVVARSALGPQTTDPRPPQGASSKSIETTVTALVTKGALFSGKRVRIRASYHSDGIDRDVLMEPNCGRFAGTTKAEPPGQPQCARGIMPNDKTENDPGSEELTRASRQGERGTSDKHITAEFTGRFRCVPACTRAKWFELEIEKIEDVQAVMKDLKPHKPSE